MTEDKNVVDKDVMFVDEKATQSATIDEKIKEAIEKAMQIATINISLVPRELVSEIIHKIASKVPDVYVFNVPLLVKMQIPANSEDVVKPTLRMHFGSNMIENTQLYLPGQQIWIIYDVYANDIKPDGSLMFFKNGIRIVETITSISKPRFTPLLYMPLEVVSAFFIPHTKADKDVTQSVVFDVIVIDFTHSTKVNSWKDVEAILQSAIEEIKKEIEQKKEDPMLKIMQELAELATEVKETARKLKNKQTEGKTV